MQRFSLPWDFEGKVIFPPFEESEFRALPRMGYFPSFRYPDFGDGGHFIARPVMGFRPDGTPYDDMEPLDAELTFRFRFLDRDRYETIHRERLTPGRRFELMESHRPRAHGIVFRTRDAVPEVEAEIERLLADLGERVPDADAKEVMAFLYHSEWECAVDLLWATLDATDSAMDPDEYDRLVGLATRVGMALPQMEGEFPLRRG